MQIIKPVPSEQYEQRICIVCKKPMMIKLKYIKLKWGKDDWRHKECYLKERSFNRF